MISILINGANGKMGAESKKAIENDPALEFSGACDIGDNLQDQINANSPTVVLDFTHPSVVMQNAITILENNAHAVIGTTGLSPDDLTALDQLAQSKNRAIAVIPNFAIGAVLMMQYASQVAKYMDQVEIIEFHHNKKADAPSGTAIKSAELIHDANPNINAIPLQEKELIPNVRGGKKANIPIHSVRLQGFVASQEIIFGGLGQTLTIKHDTINRESFMPGVLIAIKEITKKTGLVYGLEHLLS